MTISHLEKSHDDYVHMGAVYGLGVVALIFLSFMAQPINPGKDGVIASQTATSTPPLFFDPHVFANLSVTAKSYVVYDILERRIIAGRNETTALPLASVTKVMSAVTALRMADPDTRITIGENAKIDGGYDLGMKEGQAWRLDELLKYSLTFSSNSGMYAIANHFGMGVFVNRMNREAQSISPTLSFTNPAGLDADNFIGGTGSALDVALLMARAKNEIPDILDATTHQRTTVSTEKGKLTGVPNTNQEINLIAGAEASKTGYTDLAGGNLALIVDPTLGHPIAIVVLGSTRTDRFTDVEKIYQALLLSIK